MRVEHNRYYDVVDIENVKDIETFRKINALKGKSDRIFAALFAGDYFYRYFIGDQFDVVDRMDISGRIEETLRILLSADMSDEDIFAITGIRPRQDDDTDDEVFDVDLGYVISADLMNVFPVDRIPDIYPSVCIH